jgi:hypothetical protein
VSADHVKLTIRRHTEVEHDLEYISADIMADPEQAKAVHAGQKEIHSKLMALNVFMGHSADDPAAAGQHGGQLTAAQAKLKLAQHAEGDLATLEDLSEDIMHDPSQAAQVAGGSRITASRYRSSMVNLSAVSAFMSGAKKAAQEDPEVDNIMMDIMGLEIPGSEANTFETEMADWDIEESEFTNPLASLGTSLARRGRRTAGRETDV